MNGRVCPSPTLEMTQPIADAWVDARLMRMQHPETFQAPTEEQLDAIVPGDSVKVSNGKERFFVKVTEVLPHGALRGVVDNYLLGTAMYDYGDTIAFRREHVFVVHDRAYFAKEAARLVASLIAAGVPLDDAPAVLSHMMDTITARLVPHAVHKQE